jgi:hypothetical protein
VSDQLWHFSNQSAPFGGLAVPASPIQGAAQFAPNSARGLLVVTQLGQRRVAFTRTVKFADVAKVICSPKAAAPGGSACPTEIVNAARFRV